MGRHVDAASEQVCDEEKPHGSTDGGLLRRAVVGDTLTGVPAKTASGAARYSFHGGWLEGIRIGASMTYTGSRLTDLGTATVLRASLPSLQNYSAFIAYDWRAGRTRHTINFNVQNVFDQFYFTAANKLGEGRNFRLTYRLSL